MTDIGSLTTMQRSKLLDLWRDVFKSPPSKTMGRNVMCGILAFELQSRSQERQFGKLDKTFQKELKRHQTARTAGKTVKSKQPKLQQGSRLLREWNGVTHHVEVKENGYLWNGELYKSLSSIAKAITGTHWSGPRFFGLNTKGDHSFEGGYKNVVNLMPEDNGLSHSYHGDKINHHHGLGETSHHHGLEETSYHHRLGDRSSP